VLDFFIYKLFIALLDEGYPVSVRLGAECVHGGGKQP